MTPALWVFLLSLFLLVLLLLEGLAWWWDGRFGPRHHLRARLAQWDHEPMPLAPPPPPMRVAPITGPWRRFAGQRRLRRISTQFPDALDFISRALRAGHDLPRALELASEELHEPLAGELRITTEEIGFGAGLPMALSHLGTRVPLPDLQTFVVATSLHRETGGDITRMFDQLARVIRERVALRAQIKVLSAEGRLSAWILSILPIACALLMQVLHPGLLQLLTQDAVGRWVAVGALLLWGCGLILMKQLTRLEP
ncbi:MAG: type II secretion system F family protein [Burkholderiales bacterium]